MDLMTALGMFKGSIDVLRTATSVVNDAKVSAAVAEMTSHYTDALVATAESLQKNLTLVEQLRSANDAIADLQRQNQQLHAKAEQAERYELAAIADGVFVYRLKDVNTATEPAHYACPICMEAGHRVVLQTRASYGCLDCFRCKAIYWPSGSGDGPLAYPSLGTF